MTLAADDQWPSAALVTSMRLSRSTARVFDGIICFGGGDWWYHNRGHYDMQMMREMSRTMPVLHVNSMGLRVPSLVEGRMFLTRVRRKFKSLTRGFVRVRRHFGVLTVLAFPGHVGVIVSKRLVVAQVRLAAWRMGIRLPLVWVTSPPAIEVIGQLRPVGIIYQRTDRWEAGPWGDSHKLKGYDRRLKERANLTLYCSQLLYDEEADLCRKAVYVDHGVDFDRFRAAAESSVSEPAELADIAPPRIGFIGGIDAHTFDPPLFLKVAESMPDCRFILVGTCALPANWCTLPNVTMLGQRPYEEVPRYMAACDVLIMPWNQSEWIRACNPVKLKEYLAVGRPVVSTPFAELERYRGLVRVADSPGAFVTAVREALDSPPPVEAMRERVRNETWPVKARIVLDQLVEAGLACVAS